MKPAGVLFAVLLATVQEPRVREGYLLPTQAKRVEIAVAERATPAVKLAVLPVEWLDLKHPDGWNLELFNLQFFLRGQYTQRNRLNQQPFGSLADWLAQNSFDQFRFSGRAFNWVEVPWSWSDARGAGLAAPSPDELIRRAMAEVMARDGHLVFNDITHVLLLSMGSRRDMDRTNRLWPRGTTVQMGTRTIPVALMDTGLLSNRTGLDQAVGIGPMAHEFMRVLGAPTHPIAAASWCLMSDAFRGDNADARALGGACDHRPYHLCVACKAQLGWIKPVPVDPQVEQKLALRPIETHPDAFMILITPDGSEHYLLENRQRRGFDRGIPGTGLLVWHVGPKGIALVPAHGLDVPDAAWKFPLAVPFPTLQSTCFSPETIPSSRRGVKGELRVVLGGIETDTDGVAYLTTGTKAAVGERLTFEGTTYTIVPRTPSITAQKLAVAVLLVDFPDVPHAATSLKPFDDFFFRRGEWATAGDILRPTWSLGDAVAQMSGGAVAIEGEVISWVEEEKRTAWITMPRTAPGYLKTTSADFCGEAIAEYEKKSNVRALLDRADLIVAVIAGKPRPNTAMAPQSGIVKRGDRQIPSVILMEEGALLDPGPVLAGMLRIFKLHDKVAPRAATTDGGKGFCFAGGANAQQGRPGPSLLCTCCRRELGWLEPFEAGRGAYALSPLALAASAVRLPIADDEYYQIENRTQWDYDRSLPREGLLIWHVTPKDRRCMDCWENGVLDLWLAHDYPARGQPADRPGRHTPFVSLPKKGFSLQLPKGGYELSGITCDARGNMFFELDIIEK